MSENNQITEIDIVYRNKKKVAEQPRVCTSEEAYNLFSNAWDMGKIELQEQFKVMLLDRKNSCIGISTVATGGMTGCLVDLRLVFAMALKARATGIIIAHNHPSGNPEVSEEDKFLTRKFTEAGNLLDIKVLDHIVVNKEGYTSFSDRGIMPTS